MSRNGSGVYSLPSGSIVADGDTGTASQHNTPLQDLETDMNTARPIVAGGTGATSAAAARTNLVVPEDGGTYHDTSRAASWRIIGDTLEEWGEGQSRTDGTGGLTITFTKEFARVPQVFLTAYNGAGINIELIAPQTVTGFNGIVRSNSTNAAMATAVYFQWYAIGEWDGVS